MSMSIDPTYQSMIDTMQNQAKTASSNAKAASLESKLSGDLSGASDEELMDVCKSFESYLVEQVIKSTKEALAPSDEDENDYFNMFSDKLYGAYADTIVENGELGIAQKLYEAMKKDYRC